MLSGREGGRPSSGPYIILDLTTSIWTPKSWLMEPETTSRFLLHGGAA